MRLQRRLEERLSSSVSTIEQASSSVRAREIFVVLALCTLPL